MTTTTITTGYTFLPGNLSLTATNASAVYAAAGSIPTLTNAGTLVTNGGSSFYTVSFAGSGTVTNQGSISGPGDVFFGAAGAVLSNSGTITATGAFKGISLAAGGIVTNSSAGVIDARIYVLASGGAVNLDNAGIINDAGGVGASLYAGASVTNSGTISGSLRGVVIRNAAATVANTGSIDGGQFGVLITSAVGDITNTGGTISSRGHSVVLGNAGTVGNSGVITGGTVGSSGTDAARLNNMGIGVYLDGGDSFTNSGTVSGYYAVIGRGSAVSVFDSGMIGGSEAGIYGAADAALTVTNQGFIIGSTASGIYLKAAGTVTNSGGANITGGRFGVLGATGVNLQFRNDGTIFGNSLAGVQASGTMTNSSTGVIYGATDGVVLGAGSTFTNAGRIVSSNDAVRFTGSGLLVIDPGARFDDFINPRGLVVGGGGTIELAATGTAGSLHDFGSYFTGFSQIVADAGANWTIGAVTAPVTVTAHGGTLTMTDTIDTAAVFDLASNGAGEALTLAGATGTVSNAITGMSASDSIVLPSETFAGGDTASFDGVHTLTVLQGQTPVFTFSDFTPANGITSANFTVGAHDISVACFRAGTRIATPTGDVAVERLVVGDAVVTADGVRPVRWLGHRRIDCSRHPRPHDVWPVRVRAGAFAPDVPRADLWLSPDHAVLAGDGEGAAPGVLIPVRYLVNGRTIAQEPHDSVTYWHVELDRHGVLLAEGLACESYLDTGNRAAFANGGAAVQMHADFALKTWAVEACAPLVLDGPALAAVRSRLLDQAAACGHATTCEPDLRLFAAGREIAPEVVGCRHRFQVPVTACGVRLLSRSVIPAEMQVSSGDTRRLGVGVQRVIYDGRAIPLTDLRLSSGWHAMERDEDRGAWRWTDGEAGLALQGGQMLEIDVGITERYWMEDGVAGDMALFNAAPQAAS